MSTVHPGFSERPDPRRKTSFEELAPATVLMGDPEVQHIDVRLFFPADAPREEILTALNEVLQLERPVHFTWHSLISAYEIVNDGFGNVTAAREPLA